MGLKTKLLRSGISNFGACAARVTDMTHPDRDAYLTLELARRLQIAPDLPSSSRRPAHLRHCRSMKFHPPFTLPRFLLPFLWIFDSNFRRNPRKTF